MKVIDLQRFCLSDDTRLYLCQPWTSGGFRYATDGRIVLRVAVPGEVDQHLEWFPPPMKGVLETFSEARRDSFEPIALPDSPALENALRDCLYCHGVGGYKNDLIVCEQCDGYGVTCSWPMVKLEGFPLSGGALHLFHSLPGIAVYRPLAPPSWELARRLWLYFTFNGGEGVVCGLFNSHELKGDVTDRLVWPWPHTLGLKRRFCADNEGGEP